MHRKVSWGDDLQGFGRYLLHSGNVEQRERPVQFCPRQRDSLGNPPFTRFIQQRQDSLLVSADEEFRQPVPQSLHDRPVELHAVRYREAPVVLDEPAHGHVQDALDIQMDPAPLFG